METSEATADTGGRGDHQYFTSAASERKSPRFRKLLPKEEGVSPTPAADPDMNAEAKSSTNECSHCGKIFPQPYRLKRHIREVHDQEKFHKCEDCNKTFFRINNLKRHKISVHNKIRPFACLNCDAKFKDKSALKYHTKKNVCMSRSFDTFFDYTIL